MSRFAYIRFWCPTCREDTPHRRYGGEEPSTAKIECTECHPSDSPPVDWVKLACS